MQDNRGLAGQIGPGFQPVRLVVVVLAVLLLVSFAGDWYAGQVSLPRYCQQPELVLRRLAAVTTENRPTMEEARRDYLVAAKLEFLVPRIVDETLDDYLQRLRHQLQQQCR